MLSTSRCTGPEPALDRGRGTCQRLGPAAERGVVRHGKIEPEQVEDRADQPFGLAQGQAEHGPQRQRRRIARGEYQGCPPRVVRGSARQAAIASSVNQTVKLPRWRKLASYSAQLVTALIGFQGGAGMR